VESPFRSEAAAFRFLLITIGAFALIVVASTIDPALGFLVFLILAGAAIAVYLHQRGPAPDREHVEHVGAPDERRILVVANETILGEQLLDRIRARASEGPASFLIVCPQSDPARGEHPEAEQRLRSALATLRSESIDAHGQIAHPDPFIAAMEAIEDERTDEIIVSTFPGERSGWLRRDLVGRLRSESGLPVDHVVAESPVGVSG